MKSPVLNFFLLILRISLNFSLNAGHKNSRFSKTLQEKNLEFISNRKNSTIIFNLSFMLLSIKVHLISEEQGCKKNALGACGTGYIKIVLVLLIKVVSIYIRTTIVQVKVQALKILS